MNSIIYYGLILLVNYTNHKFPILRNSLTYFKFDNKRNKLKNIHIENIIISLFFKKLILIFMR